MCVVVESAKSVHAGFLAPIVVHEMVQTANDVLDRAAIVTRSTTKILRHGRPIARLLEQVTQREATLLTLGSHDHARAAGLLLGSTGSVLLREAPCSVLVARGHSARTGWPRRIVVGVDGSAEATRAALVGRALADRFDARITNVCGLGGKLESAPDVLELEPRPVISDRPPTEALVAASRPADLLIVGSRGLHGLRALGSVSERVAHEARCSVLVVRDRAEPNEGG